MPAFRTRYGNAAVRVVNAYRPGSNELYYALESLIMTAMAQAQHDEQEKIAIDTCEGLHPGLAAGLICRKCFDAVEADKMPQSAMTANEPLAPEEAASREAIDQHVKAMLAGEEEVEA